MKSNQNPNTNTKWIIGVVSVALLGGCASVGERNPQDPYERYNRTMFQFNDKADQYVMSPIARGYQKITPEPIRKGISNFFDNLRDVVSFGSNMLRGNLDKAGSDLVRVAVNSTVGLGGLINVADKEGIPNNKNTLGDTFASWGWKNSHYFVYPIKGPSTVRDSVGESILMASPVENAIFTKNVARWTAAGVKAVDLRERYLPITDALEKAQVGDKYSYVRDTYMSSRKRQIGVQPEEETDVEDLLSSDDNTSSTTPAAVPDGNLGKKIKAQYAPDTDTNSELNPLSQNIWQYSKSKPIQTPDLPQ